MFWDISFKNNHCWAGMKKTISCYHAKVVAGSPSSLYPHRLEQITDLHSDNTVVFSSFYLAFACLFIRFIDVPPEKLYILHVYSLMLWCELWSRLSQANEYICHVPLSLLLVMKTPKHSSWSVAITQHTIMYISQYSYHDVAHGSLECIQQMATSL